MNPFAICIQVVPLLCGLSFHSWWCLDEEKCLVLYSSTDWSFNDPCVYTLSPSLPLPLRNNFSLLFSKSISARSFRLKSQPSRSLYFFFVYNIIQHIFSFFSSPSLPPSVSFLSPSFLPRCPYLFHTIYYVFKPGLSPLLCDPVVISHISPCAWACSGLCSLQHFRLAVFISKGLLLV